MTTTSTAQIANSTLRTEDPEQRTRHDQQLRHESRARGLLERGGIRFAVPAAFIVGAGPGRSVVALLAHAAISPSGAGTRAALIVAPL